MYNAFMNQSETALREPAWDLLRTFAMLLGVVFHANLIFVLEPLPWITQHPHANVFSSMLTWTLHNFRMPLFFLASGYLAVGALNKNGSVLFLKKRMQRLVLPLLLAAVTTLPLTFWLWKMAGKSYGGGAFPPGFLWFLVYLMFYSLLTVPLVPLLGRIRLPFVTRFIIAWGLLAAVHFFMKDYTHVDEPSGDWLPRPTTFLYYAIFYFYGVIEHFYQNSRRAAWPFFLMALLMWILSFSGYDSTKIGQDLFPGFMKWIPALITTLYALSAISGAIQWTRNHIHHISKGVSSLFATSYWIYLTHIPLVASLQLLVRDSMLPWPLLLAFIIGVSIATLWLIFTYLVRGSWLEWVLN